MFMEPEPKLSEKQTITELSRMLETLLDRHSLKEIRTATKDSIDMEAAVMKILPKRPETSKIWKVEVEEEEGKGRRRGLGGPSSWKRTPTGAD